MEPHVSELRYKQFIPSLIWFLTFCGITAAWTYVPLLARSQGISDSAIGVSFALYGLFSLVSSYLFGRAVDISGRRRYIYSGLLLSGLTVTAHLLIYDSVTLCISRSLFGFSLGIYPAAFLDYTARSTNRIGRFSSWGSFGWGVGALLGGILSTYTHSLVSTFILSGFFFFASFMLSFALPNVPEVHQKVPLFPVQLIRKNMLVFIPLLFRHTGACGVWAFWSLFLVELGANHLWIGINQTINPFTQFLIMYLVADRIRARILFPTGLIFSALAMISFALVKNHYQLLPTQVILGISWSCCYIGALRLAMEGTEQKATASGLINSVGSLSYVLGPAMATGLIHTVAGYRALMYIASALSLLAMVLYFGLRQFQTKTNKNDN